MKIQRHIGLPEGEMAIIPDTETLIHNIVTSELEQKDKEINRLNNIINRMEEDLKEMYMTFGEFSKEYTEKQIRELKEGK